MTPGGEHGTPNRQHGPTKLNEIENLQSDGLNSNGKLKHSWTLRSTT